MDKRDKEIAENVTWNLKKRIDSKMEKSHTHKAKAYLGANQNNISNGTLTKITLNTETYDPGSNFDAVTNYRFVAPVDGFYWVKGQIRFVTATFIADKRYQCYIRKNGTTNIVFGEDTFSSAADAIAPKVDCSDIVKLNAGDFLELYIWHSAGIDTVDIEGGGLETFMTIHFHSN